MQFYRLTYLQMYIIITVCIFNKTEQGGIIAQGGRGTEKCQMSHSDSHTYWTPFLHMHTEENVDPIIHLQERCGTASFQGCGDV